MPYRNYSIVEPHPTATPRSYIPTGRGGAGNFTRTPATVTRGSDASGPASRTPLSSFSTSKSAFMTGRGGAGNVVHYPSERAIFSFDEELERQLRMESGKAPVYHVGRGGAGNVYSAGNGGVERRKSVTEDSESAKSEGSTTGSMSAEEVGRKMKKGWKRVVGVH